MKSSLEDGRKNKFCFYLARAYPPEEAARAAGYPETECAQRAAELLLRGEVRRRVKKIAGALRWCSPAELARAGLERVALGALDAGALLSEDGAARDGDLLCVCEWKRPKGGGLEVRFFDRLKALSLLAELDEGRAGAQGLLDALARAAGGREAGGDAPV